jgi:peptidoglycan biosynthesis protein MviN/MurJ (putative lipid II flippase)
VSTNANKFKETQLGAILECAVNLVISLILVIVFKLGLLGVAVGTVIGMLTRYVFEVIFLSKNVIHRSALKASKMILASAAIALISVAICSIAFDYSLINSVGMWILYAIITSLIVGTVALILYSIFYKETVKSLIKRCKGKRKNEGNLS